MGRYANTNTQQGRYGIQEERPEDLNFLQKIASPFTKTLATVERARESAGRTIQEFGLLKGVGQIAKAEARRLGADVSIESETEKIIKEESEEIRDYGRLGKIKPITEFRDAVGTGLELGSFFVGGSAAVSPIARGAIIGSKVGLVSSTGQAIREADNAGEAAGTIALGTGLGAVGGAALPAIGKGLKWTSSAVRKTLSKFSGYPEGVVERALRKTPGVSKTLKGGEEALDDIISNTIKGANKYRSDLTRQYSRELNKISSLQSLGGPGKLASRNVLLNNSKDFVSSTIRTLRKFGIGVKKDGALIFTRPVEGGRASSSIVSSAEQSNIQKAFNELLKLKSNTSVKNVDRIAQNINALRKFDTPKATRTSVVLGEISDAVDDFIRTNYPDLGKLRNDYSVSKGVLSEIESVFGKNLKPSTDVIRQSSKRLLQIFNEGELPRRTAVGKIGEEIGEDIVGGVAGKIVGRTGPSSAKIASLSRRGLLEKVVEAIPRAALKAEILSNPSKIVPFLNSREGQIIASKILSEMIK